MQLVGYPALLDEDPLPTSPMARMPYMTGWLTHIHWWYYLYTKDKIFLEYRAYPFVRDCALFYTDYLKLGDDGLYHAFPSFYGENSFDGNPESNMDAAQTMFHIKACLRIALAAAKELSCDSDLQQQWQERFDKLAPAKGESEWEPLAQAWQEHHQKNNWPEFWPAEWHRFARKWSFADRWWNWVQFLPWGWLIDVRGGLFEPEKDFADLIKVIKRWRHKNGLIWPMPTRFWGRLGPMTEGLGIIAPLQEMLLQSWNEAIEIFPVWPKNVDAEFAGLRAEGAFLVSAVFKDNIVKDVVIESLSGGNCRLKNCWESKVVIKEQANGNKVLEDDGKFLTFETQKGCCYAVEIVG